MAANAPYHCHSSYAGERERRSHIAFRLGLLILHYAISARKFNLLSLFFFYSVAGLLYKEKGFSNLGLPKHGLNLCVLVLLFSGASSLGFIHSDVFDAVCYFIQETRRLLC